MATESPKLPKHIQNYFINSFVNAQDSLTLIICLDHTSQPPYFLKNLYHLWQYGEGRDGVNFGYGLNVYAWMQELH